MWCHDQVYVAGAMGLFEVSHRRSRSCIVFRAWAVEAVAHATRSPFGAWDRHSTRGRRRWRVRGRVSTLSTTSTRHVRLEQKTTSGALTYISMEVGGGRETVMFWFLAENIWSEYFHYAVLKKYFHYDDRLLGSYRWCTGCLAQQPMAPYKM
jgi:hypothetical protein